jgi:hypothetical protein
MKAFAITVAMVQHRIICVVWPRLPVSVKVACWKRYAVQKRAARFN